MTKTKPNMSVIAMNYPSEKDMYKCQFIKTRVEEYSKYFSVGVFVYTSAEMESYVYDGINVLRGNEKDIINQLKTDSPDIIVVHGPNGNKKCLNEVVEFSGNGNIPIVAVLHGAEVMDRIRFRFYDNDSLKMMLFNLKEGFKHYFMGLAVNRRFLKKVDKVFLPSKWVHGIAEKSLCSKLNNVEYIPTFVDENLFKVDEKKEPKTILSIRSYSSRKYANDISVKVINYLKKKTYSDQMLNFKIVFYGNGKYLEKCKHLDKYNSIDFIEELIPHDELPSVFSGYKYFLCPTRLDTQGVIMCEAVMAGLIPITNHNSAMPEYLPEEILCRKNSEMANLIRRIEEDDEYYNRMIKMCRDKVKSMCSFDNTIEKELDIFDNLINNI